MGVKRYAMAQQFCGEIPTLTRYHALAWLSKDDELVAMRHLHSVLLFRAGAQKPTRQLEIPTKSQAEVLSAFKHYVDDGGVLHPKSH